jgi:hypothetical protein
MKAIDSIPGVNRIAMAGLVFFNSWLNSTLVGRCSNRSGRFVVGKTPHDKKSLETQIAATDRQIDHLVYELYGLTPEEIKIVKGAARG